VPRSSSQDGDEGHPLPLVLEIPAYRMPQPGSWARKAWQAATRFLERGEHDLVVSAVLWALLTVPCRRAHNEGATPIEESIAAGVGHASSGDPGRRVDWRIDWGSAALSAPAR